MKVPGVQVAALCLAGSILSRDVPHKSATAVPVQTVLLPVNKRAVIYRKLSVWQSGNQSLVNILITN